MTASMVWVCGPTSQAALIASDSFSVGAGGYSITAIAGQTTTVGTTGYTGAWSSGTAAHQVQGGGLTHSGTTGTPLAGQVVSFTSQNVSPRIVNRVLNYTPTTGTYYFSALFQKNTGVSSTEDMMAGLGQNQSSSWNPGGVGSHLIGIENEALVFRSDGTMTEMVSAASFALNQTYLGLMEINFSTTALDSITVRYYNASSALIANQTFSNLNLDGDMGRFVLAADRLGPNVIVDELRFGTQLADVTSIPEPSAALLGGVGALLLLRRRRG